MVSARGLRALEESRERLKRIYFAKGMAISAFLAIVSIICILVFTDPPTLNLNNSYASIDQSEIKLKGTENEDGITCDIEPANRFGYSPVISCNQNGYIIFQVLENKKIIDQNFYRVFKNDPIVTGINISDYAVMKIQFLKAKQEIVSIEPKLKVFRKNG